MPDYLLLISGVLFILFGIIGCLVPVLPGPPLSFLGLMLLHLSRFGQFSGMTLFILAAITVTVSFVDYIVPIWGTSRFGGSKYGLRGAAAGLIAGFFLGPVGILFGPFAGAVIGELIFRDDLNYAFGAGIGSLIGFLAGIGLKLASSFIITYYFVAELIS